MACVCSVDRLPLLCASTRCSGGFRVAFHVFLPSERRLLTHSVKDSTHGWKLETCYYFPEGVCHSCRCRHCLLFGRIEVGGILEELGVYLVQVLVLYLGLYTCIATTTKCAIIVFVAVIKWMGFLFSM